MDVQSLKLGDVTLRTAAKVAAAVVTSWIVIFVVGVYPTILLTAPIISIRLKGFLESDKKAESASIFNILDRMSVYVDSSADILKHRESKYFEVLIKAKEYASKLIAMVPACIEIGVAFIKKHKMVADSSHTITAKNVTEVLAVVPTAVVATIAFLVFLVISGISVLGLIAGIGMAFVVTSSYIDNFAKGKNVFSNTSKAVIAVGTIFFGSPAFALPTILSVMGYATYKLYDKDFINDEDYVNKSILGAFAMTMLMIVSSFSYSFAAVSSIAIISVIASTLVLKMSPSISDRFEDFKAVAFAGALAVVAFEMGTLVLLAAPILGIAVSCESVLLMRPPEVTFDEVDTTIVDSTSMEKLCSTLRINCSNWLGL